MESTFDRTTKQMHSQLTKFRWALGLNGLLAVVVAVVIIAWPGISLYALTILFGAYSLATGVVALTGAYYGSKGERGWLIFAGLLGIAVGLIVLIWPSPSAAALLYVIGAYAIWLGIIAVVGAFWLPLEGGDTAMMILTGLVSVAFGVVMFVNINDGAIVLLSLIAAFALVTGITELVVAIGGKRMVESSVRRAFTPQTSSS
ncbi:MAG: hypothetical protein C5B48_13595 [Candidatus Rokuibacteriota bacterium]|nr:MAG: hypothetical protein C5B48_13595 [Candidatus Rokubacteria bacterium]